MVVIGSMFLPRNYSRCYQITFHLVWFDVTFYLHAILSEITFLLGPSVILPMVTIALVPYCLWRAYRKKKVEMSLWNLFLVALAVLVAIYYVDEVSG